MSKSERIKELESLILEEYFKDLSFNMTRLKTLQKELEELKTQA